MISPAWGAIFIRFRYAWSAPLVNAPAARRATFTGVSLAAGGFLMFVFVFVPLIARAAAADATDLSESPDDTYGYYP